MSEAGSNSEAGESQGPAAWRRQPQKPALQLTHLDGATWQLSALRGDVVLLNFWASWCAPCRDELPALERLSASYQSQGLKVIAVNFRESSPTIQRFVQGNPTQLPILRDADGSAAKMLGIHIFPTTLAIDRQGRVKWWVQGDCDWASKAALSAVSQLLAS